MSTLDAAADISHAADRTRLLWAGGTVFDVVLDGARTAGAVALLDQSGRRGDVTPMHVHRNEAEIFYVLEGGIRAWSGDDVVDLEAGGAIHLPAGSPHAFGVRTAEARLITITVGPGFADFVRAAGVPVDGAAPQTWEFDVGRILAQAPLHGIDIVGPPPAL